MKVLHTVGGFTVSGGGGITTCTYDLLRSLNELGCQVDLLTALSPGETLAGNGESWIHTVDNDYKTPLALSQNFKKALEARDDYDLYHINGLWMYANHITAAIARKQGKPYIISPHGMLFPEALKRSYWKKWPMLKLWFDRDIFSAAAIHVTSQQEASSVRNFGYKGKIVEIPNPLIFPDFIHELNGNKQASRFEGNRKIGFLGRLHPIKCVDILIKGLALSNNRHSITLYLLGDGDTKYVDELKRIVSAEKLEDNVIFWGFVSGRRKYELISEISTIFLPSYSENFGMIVPESLIMGTPVAASKGTPWQSLQEERCGWWIDRTPQAIAKVIDEVASLPAEELRAMGDRGRKMVLARYNAPTVAHQMINHYSKII